MTKIVKAECWKWWSTPVYYLLLPFYLIRVPYWWLRYRHGPNYGENDFFNLLNFAQGMCDMRAGRLYKLDEAQLH